MFPYSLFTTIYGNENTLTYRNLILTNQDFMDFFFRGSSGELPPLFDAPGSTFVRPMRKPPRRCQPCQRFSPVLDVGGLLIPGISPYRRVTHTHTNTPFAFTSHSKSFSICPYVSNLKVTLKASNTFYEQLPKPLTGTS